MECALLKQPGVLYNISEDNIQNLQLKYYSEGDTRKDNDTDDVMPDSGNNSDVKPTPIPDIKPTPSKKIPTNYNPNTENHVYTLYRASDMRLICYNVVNLKALIDLLSLT